MEEPQENLANRGYRMLLALACLVVVVGGLKLSRDLLVPVVVAFFLSVLSMPILRTLRSWGIPRFPAVLLTVVVDIGIFSPAVLIGLNLTSEFQAKYDSYQVGLSERFMAFRDWVRVKFEYEIQIDTGEMLESIRTSTFNFLGGAAEFLKDFTFVFIIMIFFLSEAGGFSRKMGAISNAGGPDLNRFKDTSTDVQKYLGIKTLISALTGLLAGLGTVMLGLDFAMLWGMVAFVFNYIPAIGSIVAALPPMALALVDQGPGTALLVLGLYLAINMVLGNFIEPTLLGRRFGISTSMVVLSVVFWGWIWGLVGMFLAVPLTMLLKVGLDNSDDFRWVSIAMGKHDGKMAALKDNAPPAGASTTEGKEAVTADPTE